MSVKTGKTEMSRCLVRGDLMPVERDVEVEVAAEGEEEVIQNLAKLLLQEPRWSCTVSHGRTLVMTCVGSSRAVEKSSKVMWYTDTTVAQEDME